MERLRERGDDVSYPDLPDPDEPSLDGWLDALERELAGLDADGLVAACHSLGAVTWLHLAARTDRRLAERVLLVAPPSAGCGMPEIAEFVPAPLDARGGLARRRARPVSCARTQATPTGLRGRKLFEPLRVPIDVIQGGGHLNTDAGYGPWPAVEAWCLDAALCRSPPLKGASASDALPHPQGDEQAA